MFREITRKKQALTREEAVAILETEPRGVLSVIGDGGYPYGIPMDHWYCPEDGHLYFHGSVKGHKVDAIRADNRVSFCVYDQGYRREGEWSLNIKSVVVFGRIRFVEDRERAAGIIRRLARKYTDDTDYIEQEIRDSIDHTLCMELIPEHITGKITNES